MLLLLPDLLGGFSFYKMARQFPDSPFWTTLAAQFSHVQWSGASVWDLVMPSFVFLVGVAMPLSAAARRSRGDSPSWILTHVLLRATALLLLALILRIPGKTYLAELWPLVIIAAGLPVAAWTAGKIGITDPAARRRLELCWWLAILGLSTLWLGAHIYDIGDYRFEHIFSQLALASLFAFLFVGKPRSIQLVAALAILLFYWLLFAVYPPPAPGFDPVSVGVMPGEEIFSGFFAHWNKNTNAASAFDVWFLNLLPRAQPFQFDSYGVTTLNFVPTVSTMIFGVMAGELVRRGQSKSDVRNGLFWAGVLGIVAGLLAAQWLCPLVKSLWTPSWTIFSAGIAALVLAVFYHLCEIRGARLAFLAILGTNAILLYVLASNYRWRFLSLPERLFGVSLLEGPYAPVRESVLLALMLWAVAFVLYRWRIFVRL
jgi:predicted acyltransferase